MVHVLLTGFEPFGGSRVNPSELVVRALAERTLPGVTLSTVILPVDSHRGPAMLRDAVEHCRPDAVVCLGEARGRAAISLERRFVNVLDFRIPDNDGRVLRGRPIVPGGPEEYASTLPLDEMRAAIAAAHVPVENSWDAGKFLCNQVSYELLHLLNNRRSVIPAGFVHLPRLPEQADDSSEGPTMPLEQMCQGVQAALAALSKFG